MLLDIHANIAVNVHLVTAVHIFTTQMQIANHIQGLLFIQPIKNTKMQYNVHSIHIMFVHPTSMVQAPLHISILPQV